MTSRIYDCLYIRVSDKPLSFLESFVPYCASLTKRATLESSVAGSSLIGLAKMKISGSETLATRLSHMFVS